MTDFYKNNDDLLRDKLTQHEFAPIPNAWENMSALLDQQQVVPKRAAGYWWSIPFVTAAALAGVIGLGVYLHSTPTTASPAAPILAKQNAKTTTTVDAKPVIASAPQEHQQALIIKNVGAINNTNSDNTNPLGSTTVKSAKKNPVTRSKSASSKQPVQTVSRTKKSATKKKAVVNEPIINKTTINSNSHNNNVALENAIKEVTTKENKRSKPRVKTTRTEVIYQYSLTPLRALQSKRKAMEQQNTIGNFGIGDELNTKKSPLKVGVFGGASAKVYRNSQKLSVMPYAGVNASYRVAKHHGVQVGLQYKSMGRLPNPKNNSENNAITYTVGTKTSQSHVLNRIDMLEMPLVYQFHPHPRYNVQAGVKAAWLFNTESTSPELNPLSNKEMGLADFDFSILLGMEYCFNKHWSVGLQYSIGLVNLTQQAKAKHDESIQADLSSGVDPQGKIQALSDVGELLVPVAEGVDHQQMIRLPNQLHNNDVQLLLKYTF
ncbi:porin family protein [Aureispira anguillae]|uniref:PorT family protein n=1 Tax=Aureispira anguillae TaxID=2864201 RepID=A0A915YH65_9BACT|nr:porin family protein [Aureispira anguillae]BDS12952.1 PorT family protein [Aureispira anguillae]